MDKAIHTFPETGSFLHKKHNESRNMNIREEAAQWLREDVSLPTGLRLEVTTQQDQHTLQLRGLGFDVPFLVEVIQVMAPSQVIREVTKRQNQEDTSQVLFVLPYLSPRTAQVLWQHKVSALDLCGNVQILVPGQVVLQRLGEPNRFPNSSPIQDIWNGTSSLVPRALLEQRQFPTQTALQHWIEKAGGSISKGTVSKVLRVLEDGLWVNRKDRITLQHPEALLDAMLEGYQPPRIQRKETIKADLSMEDALMGEVRWSPETFALMGQAGQAPRFYTRDLSTLLRKPGIRTTRRFADAEVWETSDPGVFFAPHQGDKGPCVSRLEVYLQLATGGQRDQDAAAQIRHDIIQGVSP